jgi:transcriptional regulator with XRE-family HTH domain
MIDKKVNKRVGEGIRAIRRAKGMTLQQVAAQSGLSVGFMSQIERNLTGITLSSLVNVAKALGVPLSDLVTQPEQTGLDSHQGKRKVYSVEQVSLRYERLSTVFPGSCMHAVKITVPAGFTSESVSHAGEELIFMLTGQLEYIVKEKTYTLGPGDSLHFDAACSHRFSNIGKGAAEVLWAGTLPLFEEASKPGKAEHGDPVQLFGSKYHKGKSDVRKRERA